MPFSDSDRRASRPLVSVIIPTHNRSAMALRAVRSVLGQTYPHLECLVVDDASTDDTQATISTVDDDRLVYLRHEQNRGASAARNTGIAHARGKLVAFLDDDDKWLPTKLEKQVSLLQESPNVGMVYCWLDYWQNGRVVREHHPSLRGDVLHHLLDRQRLGNASTLLVRREILAQVGGFDEQLPRCNDGEFIRRVCHDHAVDVVEEVLVRVHVGHSDRLSIRDSLDDVDYGIDTKLTRLGRYRDAFEDNPSKLFKVYALIARDYVYRWRLGKHWHDLSKALRFALLALLVWPARWRILTPVMTPLLRRLGKRRS